jgi:hypothetical protein
MFSCSGKSNLLCTYIRYELFPVTDCGYSNCLQYGGVSTDFEWSFVTVGASIECTTGLVFCTVLVWSGNGPLLVFNRSDLVAFFLVALYVLNLLWCLQ